MSISRTVGVIVAGVLVVTLGCMFAVLLLNTQRTMEHMDGQRAEAIEHTIADSLVYAMGEGVTDVKPLVAELQGKSGVVEMRVMATNAVRADAERLLDAVEREVMGSLKSRSMTETFKGAPVARSVSPILATAKCTQCHQAAVGQPLAVLSLRSSTAEAAAVISNQRLLGIGMGILSVALCFGLLMVLIKRQVVAPLTASVVQIGRLAQGDLTESIAVQRQDEFGTLQASLVTLQSSLKLKAEAAEQIALGNLDVDIQAGSAADVLSHSMTRMRDSLRSMAAETDALIQAALAGRLSIRADVSRHQGSFRKVIEGINKTMDAVIGPLSVTAECIDRISKGDIPAPITQEYRGDFNELKVNVNACIAALERLRSDVRTLSIAATEGRLTERADVTFHQGAFRKIVLGFNGTLDAVIKPMGEAASYIDRIAAGDIPPVITADYRGDFNGLKKSINGCIGNVNALIADTRMLSEAAVAGRLTVRADAARHGGDFRVIVEGINGTLDAVIGPLSVAADYVARIGRGDIPARITDEYRGDFDGLKRSLNSCIDGLGGLVEVSRVLQAMTVNDFTQPVRGTHQGVFANVARNVNTVLESQVGTQSFLERIANGDLSGLAEMKAIGSGTGRRSEHDKLVPAFVRMMESISGLVTDASRLSAAAVAGRLSQRADATRHAGEFRRVIEGVNATLDAVIGPLNVAAEYVDRISKGDIPPKVADQFQGDFNELKNNINGCIDAISGLVVDANRLVEAAVAGQLKTRADAGRHGGDFRRIVEGVNRTLDAVTTPVNEAAAVLDRVANQDLRVEVVGAYTGEHAAIKTSINKMVIDLRGSITSIGGNAQALAQASEQLTGISQAMASNAEETAAQTGVVSSASEQVSKNLTVVATSSEEMLASIRGDRQERQRGGQNGAPRGVGRGRDERHGPEARRLVGRDPATSSRSSRPSPNRRTSWR